MSIFLLGLRLFDKPDGRVLPQKPIHPARQKDHRRNTHNENQLIQNNNQRTGI